MKANRIEYLIREGDFAFSDEFGQLLQEVYTAIFAVCWPAGSNRFILCDKKNGNGVTPIKEGFLEALREESWECEQRISLVSQIKPGKIDAAKQTSWEQPLVVEWETGNISSSHRALNKIALGLLQQAIVGGVLVVPSRKMYPWLTDRIGNFAELEPYFPVWKALAIAEGVLAIIEVEHDGVSDKVPCIGKGTDGRALR